MAAALISCIEPFWCQRQWLGDLCGSFRPMYGRQHPQGGEESCHAPDPDWWTKLPARPKLGRPSRSENEKLRRVDRRADSAFAPAPLAIAERYRFHKRDQAPGETVATYVAEVRRMARYCDFGGNLEISLRDRFVWWLKNKAVIKKLLQEKDLDLPKAIAIATATEIASRDAADLGKGSTTAAPVHSIRKQRLLPKTSSSLSRDNCFRCGRMGRTPQNCKCKEMDCLQCGKRGHIARACPVKNNSKPSWSKHQRQSAQHRLSKTHALKEGEDVCCTTFLPHLPERRPWWRNIEPTINGTPMRMELDTGSALSIIPDCLYHHHFSGLPLSPTSVVLKTYGGERIKPLGSSLWTSSTTASTTTARLSVWRRTDHHCLDATFFSTSESTGTMCISSPAVLHQRSVASTSCWSATLPCLAMIEDASDSARDDYISSMEPNLGFPRPDYCPTHFETRSQQSSIASRMTASSPRSILWSTGRRVWPTHSIRNGGRVQGIPCTQHAQGSLSTQSPSFRNCLSTSHLAVRDGSAAARDSRHALYPRRHPDYWSQWWAPSRQRRSSLAATGRRWTSRQLPEILFPAAQDRLLRPRGQRGWSPQNASKSHRNPTSTRPRKHQPATQLPGTGPLLCPLLT